MICWNEIEDWLVNWKNSEIGVSLLIDWVNLLMKSMTSEQPMERSTKPEGAASHSATIQFHSPALRDWNWLNCWNGRAAQLHSIHSLFFSSLPLRRRSELFSWNSINSGINWYYTSKLIEWNLILSNWMKSTPAGWPKRAVQQFNFIDCCCCAWWAAFFSIQLHSFLHQPSIHQQSWMKLIGLIERNWICWMRRAARPHCAHSFLHSLHSINKVEWNWKRIEEEWLAHPPLLCWIRQLIQTRKGAAKAVNSLSFNWIAH